MRCPFCDSEKVRVRPNSRKMQSRAYSVRREKVCLDCGRGFETYEYYDKQTWKRIKANGGIVT